MSIRTPLALFVFLFGLAEAAFARDVASISYAELGVRVEKPVGDGRFSQGSGILLDGGLILTAAHVITYNPTDPKVTVLLGGRRVGATVAFDGTPGNVDLALLQLDNAADGGRASPPVQVCNDNPATNAGVVVSALGTVTQTKTIPTPLTSKAQNVGAWTNLLAAGYYHGNSGGGVFDARRGCLWGIITHVMTGPSTSAPGKTLELTAFSPALEVSDFLEKYRTAAKR